MKNSFYKLANYFEIENKKRFACSHISHQQINKFSFFTHYMDEF